jgi:hypothetical protein
MLVLAALLLAPASQAAFRTYSQLWQIGGHSLPDLDELCLPLGELEQPAQPRRNPALISGSLGWGLAVLNQFQTGDARNTSTRAVPRAEPWLPAAAALRGWAGPLALGLGWEQRYNSHEQTLITPFDSLSAWADWDARLERWSLQTAWEILPYCCARPGLRLGAGLSRNSLRVDQVEAERYLGAWSWQAGARLQTERIFLAVSHESRVTYDHTRPFLHLINGRAYRDTIQVWGRLPRSWHLQVGIVPRAGWSIDLALRHHRWSEQLLGFRDRLEAGLTLHHGLPGRLNWHLGVCSSGSDPVTGTWLDQRFAGEQNTFFLMGGLSAPLGPARLDLKVADSNLGPGAYRRQTIVQAGLSATLPGF